MQKSNHDIKTVKPPHTARSRMAMLGGAAAIAFAGAFGSAQILPVKSAVAETTKPVQVPAVASVPSFADVIERVSSAVVSIKVTVGEVSDSGGDRFGYQGPRNFGQNDPMERFFRQFGQRGPMPGMPRPGPRRSQGSGFIISSDGYVVTNNHVVRNASKLEIGFENGKTAEARVVGIDEKTDLALLKITEPGTYKFVEFADKLPRVGDWVIAVGNPFGLGGTVTAGIVSARGRDIGSGPYDNYLQIDAPVNRGNSGGPTFDVAGRVVGVNTAIYSPSGGSVGIGFAIPSTVVKKVVAELKENGTVSRGFIGVQIQPVTPEIADSLGLNGAKGALVAETTPGLPADKAGLRAGDVIVSVNGEKIDSPRALARKIAGIDPGSRVTVRYFRDGREAKADLTLAAQPNQRRASLGAGRAPVSPVTGPRFGMMLAPAGDVAGAGENGVVVAQIDPSGLAARQGLRSGDIILEAGGKTVAKPADFSQVVDKARKDGAKAVLLRVKSGSGTRFVALALRERNAG